MLKYNNYMIRRTVAILFLAAAVLITSLATGSSTLSKYQLESRESAAAYPSGFRFESDFLKAGGAEYDIPGGAFNIQLYNFSGENVSDSTIEYSVTVENGSPSTADGSIPAGAAPENKKTAVLEITPDENAATVKVTAVSEAPYRKTLEATFRIRSAGEAESSYTDYGGYGILTLMADTAGSRTINWNAAELAPDSTNPLMGAAPVPAYTVSGLQGATEYEIIFFEKTSGEYQAVTREGTICLERIQGS